MILSPFWPTRRPGKAAQQHAPKLRNGFQNKIRGSDLSPKLIVALSVGGIFFLGYICFLSLLLPSTDEAAPMTPYGGHSFPFRKLKKFDIQFQKETTAILAFLDDPNKISDIDEELQNWDYPLVHIVNTRFMQEQGHLKALGMARLYLFRTFCLPTIIHQSTQQFMWIIKTDPALDATILEALVDDLRPYPNIYLVASNNNFRIRDHHDAGGNSWRDGAEIRDLLQSPIYTGDRTRLYQAMLQKDRQIVLETRLDADDGLHQYFLQQIQEKALKQFTGSGDEEEEEEELNTKVPNWLFWCTRRHVEWHGGVREKAEISGGSHSIIEANNISSSGDVDYHGTLLVIEHSKLCITPGITVGFGIGTASDEVPVHSHDKLFKAIRSLNPKDACGYDKASHCLELVEDFLLMAVRARTPTSAGMQRVGTDEDEDEVDATSSGNHTKSKHKQKRPPKVSPSRMYMFWELLHDDFFVLREQVKYTNKYILDHLVPIAKNNLEGQCTSEHSCKVGVVESKKLAGAVF